MEANPEILPAMLSSQPVGWNDNAFCAGFRQIGGLRLRPIPCGLLQDHVSAATLGGPAISGAVVDSIEERHEIGPAGVQTRTRDRGFNRVAHLNVGCGEGVSSKPK